MSATTLRIDVSEKLHDTVHVALILEKPGKSPQRRGTMHLPRAEWDTVWRPDYECAAARRGWLVKVTEHRHPRAPSLPPAYRR